MKKNNYVFDTAVNGLKAVQAYRASELPYNVVIMGKGFQRRTPIR